MGLDNPLHIAFLLLIVLLVFGAKRLPEMGRSLGSGLRGFKDSLGGESGEPPLLAASRASEAAVAEAATATVAPEAPRAAARDLAA